MRYRRILVPLDGSQRAEHVLPMASALAERHAAELVLLHVVVKPELIQRMPLTDDEIELVDKVVQRNVQTLNDARQRLNISEIERGQKEASSELLASLCAALDLPLSDVLREVSDAVALEEAALGLSRTVEATPLAVARSAGGDVVASAA